MTAAADNREALEHRAFKGKRVCFTGAMVSMLRKDAASLVVQAGGTVSGTVSKATDYLVLGEAGFFNFVDGHATTKSKKAMRLIEGGASIEVISEHTARKMLAREDEDGF